MEISIHYLDQHPLHFWMKDWIISDHIYDEWKTTLVLTPTPLPGMEISIHFIYFYFDGFPNRPQLSGMWAKDTGQLDQQKESN